MGQRGNFTELSCGRIHREITSVVFEFGHGTTRIPRERCHQITLWDEQRERERERNVASHEMPSDWKELKPSRKAEVEAKKETAMRKRDTTISANFILFLGLREIGEINIFTTPARYVFMIYRYMVWKNIPHISVGTSGFLSHAEKLRSEWLPLFTGDEIHAAGNELPALCPINTVIPSCIRASFAWLQADSKN